MIWSEVEDKYGKEMADKMKKSQYLFGITCVKRDDGELDIPESDIELAYKDVTGQKIHPYEVD